MAKSTALKSEINSLDTRLSVNMFLADIPKVVNNAFNVIKTALNSFYDAAQGKIFSDLAKFTRLEADTIITKNISLLNGDSSDTITFDVINEVSERLTRIEKELKLK